MTTALISNSLSPLCRLPTKDITDGLKRIFTFLTVSSLFVGGTGFFQTYAGYIFLGITPNILTCLSVFLVTFSVYNLNKLTDIDEDAINVPERTNFIRGRKKMMLYISLSAYAISAILALMDRLEALPIVFIPLITNAVYSSKLLPGISRFKDIPVMKNVFVALSWALVCTLMPAVHLRNWTVAVPLAIYFMIARVFINTVLFDIRDVEGDKKNGVMTIPVLIGTRKTTTLLLAINSSLLPCLMHRGSGALLSTIMITYAYAFISYFRVRRNPLALDLFVDGEWMIGCIVFIALSSLGLISGPQFYLSL